MSRTIFKYELFHSDVQNIPMPFRSQILCVKQQNISTFLWVLQDNDLPTDDVSIFTFGTGDILPDDIALTYIDTVIYNFGEVYHYFRSNVN